MKSAPETLIIGQGLAGTVLALRLEESGRPYHIIDEGAGHTSSRAALGLLNPVTGMRFTPTWMWDDCWAEAQAFYARAEDRFDRKFFRETPIYRLFRDEKEKNRWQKFRQREGVLDWIEREYEEEPELLRGHVRGELGGMRIPGGWLEIDVFLDAARRHFQQQGVLTEQRFDPRELVIEPDSVTLRPGTAAAQPRRFDRVVFCEGFLMSGNPWFGDFPLALAKGQSLTIRMADFPADLAVVRKIFFLPLRHAAEGAILRIGATWEWDDLTPEPTAEGRLRLEELIRGLTDQPFEVLEQSAGVRPITKDKKPLVGTLPGRPHVAILNGLGSKGSLLAPYFARQLLRHLDESVALDPKVDPCRNLG